MFVKKLGMSAASTKMVEALTRHSGKRRVDLEDTCLSGIQPGLLVQALSNLERVNLTRTQLTFDQITHLCSSLLDGTILLKSLSLARNNLSSAGARLLGEAVGKVEEEIDLRNSRLTVQQTEAIFAAIESSGQPRKVCLRHNNISPDVDILVRATCKVEEMDLRHTSITNQQIQRIIVHNLFNTSAKPVLDK